MGVDKVLVYAESSEGKVTTATLELLTKAREIASTVEAVYAGSDDTATVAAQVGEYGATKLHVIDAQGALPGHAAAAEIGRAHV